MIFLDTNILVYAVDGKYPEKQDVARYCGVKAVNPFK